MFPDSQYPDDIRVPVDLGECFGCHPVLVRFVGCRPACQQDLDYGSVSIRSGKVQRCGTYRCISRNPSNQALYDAPAAPTLGAVLFLLSLYLLGSLGALTSAPLSINIRTTLTLPPEQAAWSGRTPWRTELTG